jgi:hypothetical protein
MKKILAAAVAFGAFTACDNPTKEVPKAPVERPADKSSDVTPPPPAAKRTDAPR